MQKEWRGGGVPRVDRGARVEAQGETEFREAAGQSLPIVKRVVLSAQGIIIGR